MNSLRSKTLLWRTVAGKFLISVPAAGFKKLEPNEHPRLIFRQSDLPMIKQRLETPEGQAIMARFLAPALL